MIMKTLNFAKMAGAGNDFIVIDAVKGIDYKKLTPQICDRTNGIGADGLLILDRSKSCDYKMRIINSDGSEAEMCGNGARCMAAYIVKTRKPKKKIFSMETLAGEILAQGKGESANVRLTAPKGYKPDVLLKINDRDLHAASIDTGVPHAVIFVDNLKSINVKEIGRIIRYHQAFQPRGTNVNFAEELGSDLVTVRTYERGVEDETKACGTGSVATAVVAYLKSNLDIQNKKNAKMKVKTQGGEILEVTFDLVEGQIFNVWLKGSARFIAQGKYFL